MRVDQIWLQELPQIAIPISVSQSNYIEIKTGANSTTRIDHFVHITTPWVLVSTVDAWKHGSIISRVLALTWIEQTIAHESVLHADAEQNNWWRAELLLSLRYARERMTAFQWSNLGQHDGN